jgi:hypothetical protein
MGKKNRKDQPSRKEIVTPVVNTPIFSKTGRKIFAGGIVATIIGYIVLSFTDSAGQNLPSTLSPFLILSGYALIGISIITKDPTSPT